MIYVPKSQHLSLARHTSASSFLFRWQQGRRLAVSASAKSALEAVGAANGAVTGTLLAQRVGTPNGAIALVNTAQTIFSHLLTIIATPGAEAILSPGLLRATVVHPTK